MKRVENNMIINCTHTSDVTFKCLWPDGNVLNYTINGTTILWDLDPTSYGTYDGERTVKWGTGGTWVKQNQGRRNSLSYN